MCGITGYYTSKSGLVSSQKLTDTTNLLTNRGPNASGIFESPSAPIGLGHRRLSIIDTSAGGNQPMTTQDGKYTLVFNGEIYNYQALKTDLISKGYHFGTSSDTEVLLNLYHLHGNAAWNLLNGFFAVAILNNETHELTLARDRVGIKPLYYHWDGSELYFGSELKTILSYLHSPTIDHDALRLYLKLNYIPAPHSILHNTFKLLGGECLSFNGTELQKWRFYEVGRTNDTTLVPSPDYQTAQNQLKKLMRQSVTDRMVADVPLGTFLSGGIDSSVITALASEQKSGLNTFSVGFKNHQYFDETAYARLVAERYQTNHHEIILSNTDLLTSLNDLLHQGDEPFADSSALAVNALCKETKQHVTVALSGDGADELFAGYNKYMGEYRIQNPQLAEKLVSRAGFVWERLPSSRNGGLSNTIRKLKKFSRGAHQSKQERYLEWCSLSKEDFLDRLLVQSHSSIYLQKSTALTEYLSAHEGLTDLLINDQHLVLVNDMLTKVDTMSMNNSLEVRVPFLDHSVVEFANRLPDSFKINRGIKKRIVQDAFRDLLPHELYNRPKHGFEVPMLDWLRNQVNHQISTHLLDQNKIKAQGLFDYEALKSLVQKLHSNNPEDSHATIWALLVFQVWHAKTFKT